MERQLPYGQAYPMRPPFFFAMFVRLLSKVAVVQEVGLLGRVLLEEIVYVEDKRHYKDAPRFWVNSLADRCGRHRNNVTAARKLCQEAGWLHWEQRHDREMATPG